MPKKKPKKESQGDESPESGASPRKPAKKSASKSKNSRWKLSSAEIGDFRRAIADAGFDVSDDDVRTMLQQIEGLRSKFEAEISREEVIELFKATLSSAAKEFDGIADDEWSESEEVGEALDPASLSMDEWDVFVSQHFPADFFEGSDAINEALQLSNKKKRRRAIVEITEKFPRYGNGWLELARLESDPEQARDYLHQALNGSRWMLDLAKEHPERAEGLKRGFIMLGLDVAGEFWLAGQRIDTLEIQQQLLKVDHRDIGGQRLIYAFRLFEQGWFDELDEQVEKLEQETQSIAGVWLLKSFILFARDHDFEKAAEALRESYTINSLTFDTLLAGIHLEEGEEHAHDSPEVEGHWLGSLALAPAAGVNGLQRWMRDVLDYEAPEIDSEGAHDRGLEIEDLLQLRQVDGEWFLDSRAIGDGFVTIVGDSEEMELIGFDHQSEMPSPDELWDVFVDTMEHPELDEPCRPQRLVVSAPALVKSWQANCDKLGIEIEFRDDLHIPDRLYDFVSRGMSISAESIELDQSTLDKAAKLPRSEGIWYVGTYRPPLWIHDSATPRRPWMNLVVDSEAGLVRMQEMSDGPPADDFLCKTVTKAFFMSMVPDEEACLPTEIRLCTPDLKSKLADLCDQLDIELVETDDDEELTHVVDSLVLMSSSPELRTPMHESADLGEDELRSLYRDFALFYRAAPWRSAHRDQYLEIIAPALERPKFYAKLVGMFGDHRGVFVGYEEEVFQDIEGDADWDDFESTVLNYDEAYTICPTDFLLMERYGFECAGENAFPLIQHCPSSKEMNRPDRGRVLEIQIAVRAFMALAERPKSDRSEEFTLPTIEGPIQVGLRWIHC
jgi:hypothetical protein